METFFPMLLLSILAEFRQCFSKPNYEYFRAYIWAMMINNSSKCMTNMAEACFFLGKHLSSFARFLADNKWDCSKAKKKMVEILLNRFPGQFLINGAFLGVVDTTLIAKASKKMFGVQKWHPSSGTAEKINGVFGHHWGLIGLMLRHPIRNICFPIIARLVPGKKNNHQWIVGPDGLTRAANFWDTAISLVRELKSYLPQSAKLRIVADAYFSKVPFILGLRSRGVHLISRLRKDAKGWDRFIAPVIHRPRRGRPRTKGREWKLAELLRYIRPTELEVSLYGKTRTLEVVTRDVYLRGFSDLVRVVVIKTETHPLLLVSTDLTLLASQIIEIYGSRFSIEITIRDLKQHFGLTDYQCYSTVAIFRFVTLSCISFCCWMITLLKNDSFLTQAPKSDFHKTSLLSFNHLKSALKRFVIQQIIFLKFNNGADFEKINKELDPFFCVI